MQLKKITRGINIFWRFRRKQKPDTFSLCMTLFALGIALTIPLWAKGYLLFQFSSICIYALALIGLNLLTGYNGQLSVGHGAIYGIGAFAMGIIVQRWQIPYYLALPIVTMLSFLIGILFGFPATRLENISLALATFSLAVTLPQIFERFDTWTGGVTGMQVAKATPPVYWVTLGLTYDQWIYMICLGILLFAFYFCGNLIESRAGRAIRAIRDNDISSNAMGINNNLYKVVCFGLSSMITGTAGALSALLLGHVAPETFNAHLSITFLTGIIVGGLGSLFGPIYGALFIQYVPNYTDHISKALTSAIYGIVLILFMYFDPHGFAGLLRTLRIRLKEHWSYFKF